jgi:hypothetical protein
MIVVERIGRRGAAEGQFHMGVRIDSAGDDKSPLGVDDLVGIRVDRPSDHGDRLAVDEDVRVVVVDCGDDVGVFDEGCGHDSFSSCFAIKECFECSRK